MRLLLGKKLTVRHVYIHLVAEPVEQFVYMDCFALVLLDLHSCMAIFSFLAGEYVSTIKMPCDLLKTETESVIRDVKAGRYPTHSICLIWVHLDRIAGPNSRVAHLMFR